MTLAEPHYCPTCTEMVIHPYTLQREAQLTVTAEEEEAFAAMTPQEDAK